MTGIAMETVALCVLLMAAPAVYATEFTVGDKAGWNTGVDYGAWSTGKTFKVGDTLVFTYSTSHSVDVVHKEDYDQCDTGDALQTYTGGNNTIALNKTGPVYFLCPALGHCGEGMKLAVTVSAATPPSPTPPSTPSPTPPSTPPPTPSTHAPPPPSGATSKLRSMDVMLVGAAILMALVLALLV